MSPSQKLKSVTLIQPVFFDGSTRTQILASPSATGTKLDLSNNSLFIVATPPVGAKNRDRQHVPLTNVATCVFIDEEYDAEVAASKPKPPAPPPAPVAATQPKSALKGVVKMVKDEHGNIVEKLV